MLILFLVPGIISAQSLELLTPLSDTVSESSSLIYLHNRLITNNDSGGDAQLYEIDSLTGNVTRTVNIQNAQNVDWEALCYDSLYIYIGDFGNNNGSRTDLTIYRISQTAYFGAPDSTVSADAITFHYSNQTDFSSAPFQTNFDAEAFLPFGDSLYIFTKNWGNHRTNIYPVPKIPGDYSLTKTDSINVEGLVTGAAFLPESESILLSCYTLASPFAFRISDFSDTNFSDGNFQSIDLQSPSGYSYQIEGIAKIQPNLFYFTSEGGFAGAAGLYKLLFLPTSFAEKLKPVRTNIYPNPASGVVTISGNETDRIFIYDASGKLIQMVAPGKVDVSAYSSGVYLLKFFSPTNELVAIKRLVIP